jgi:inner membrane protein
MASIFGHAVVALGVSSIVPRSVRSPGLVGLGMLSACMPDIDVLGFFFGIPYEHLLGHRGLTHSILFGLCWSLSIGYLYFKVTSKRWSWAPVLYLAICTVSHGLIDACTSGGHGIALYVPIDNNRVFFDFRPILVSPLGVKRFFSEWGMRVLLSEAVWLGLPSLALVVVTTAARKITHSMRAR